MNLLFIQNSLIRSVFVAIIFSMTATLANSQCINEQFTSAGLSENDFAQSFTIPANCSGNLTSIVFERRNIQPSNQGVRTASIKIFVGETIVGSPQYTQTGITIATGAGDRIFNLSGGSGSLAISPNTLYTAYIELDGNTDWRIGQNNVGDSYAGGNSYWIGQWWTDYDLDFIVNTSAVLPVELTYFKGKNNKKANLLTWQTASETNNDGFEIEWSFDNLDKREWQSIGYVNGAGSSFEIQNYSFTHKSPHRGINYYRLKQMDYDGNFEYSDIVSVDFEDLSSFSITPNPVQNGFFTLYIPENEPQVMKMTICNSMGALVRQAELSSFQTEINVDELEKGIYWIQVDLDGLTKWRRLVVQ